MNTLYTIDDNLYLNITNKCTNRCVFCIGNFTDTAGNKNLWLEREPTSQEVIADLSMLDLKMYKEVVFCGFGEPLLRIELVKKISSFIKEKYPEKKIRIDTNGHANLFHGRNIVPELAPYINAISISLNAENKGKYNKISRPLFEDAYDYLLDFIALSKNYIKDVTATVVDLPSVDIEKCKEIADKLNVNFRVRDFIRNL
ncbi:MAG TPA: TatD family nuclease-associated radical SAM protein [Dictyoglomaceae bacterium]|nr:TatD family nuclease-associated radical SAM protein [Dictyoglomaceae bacterium]HPU44269.1 TatD family nuclease-associated radical SAM protein [Dictyoglomaceae bacterium]